MSSPAAPEFSLTKLGDVTALGPSWRALEAVAQASFFQSWTWIGTLAEERFPDPWLFTAKRHRQIVAMALFNQRQTTLARSTLFLTESGDPVWDSLTVEHNGLLCSLGHEDVIPPALDWLANSARLVLSGVDAATYQSARQTAAALRLSRLAVAPFIDFDLCAPGTDGLIAHCSANTRQQLRRSSRKYEAEFGPLQVQRAASVPEALMLLDILADLHQSRWTARGKPGAFAHQHIRRFHQALITEALPRGEVDLLRVTAGEHLIGALYNFRYRGNVLNYQGGFNYRTADAQQKPGLTAHHLAMVLYRAEEVQRYDLLAGAPRYKTSLANGSVPLYWAELMPRWSLRGMITRLRSVMAT